MYKAMLRERRRKPTESIQEYYHDICRLVQQGYPGQQKEHTDQWALECFINGLADPELQRILRDKDPSSIECAFAESLRQIAISGEIPKSGNLSDRKARSVVYPN